jgi:hypothetical protein
MGFLHLSDSESQVKIERTYNYSLRATLCSSTSASAWCSTSASWCAATTSTSASAIASTSLPSGQLLLFSKLLAK